MRMYKNNNLTQPDAVVIVEMRNAFVAILRARQTVQTLFVTRTPNKKNIFNKKSRR